ncbi:hypothetical protein BH23CHL4_BH23CHL4_30470 [soil metagenome]
MVRRVHHQAGARPHESAAAGEPPEEHGYLPPRLSWAEAIQEAALMSVSLPSSHPGHPG